MNYSEILKTNAVLKSIIESPENVVIFALDTGYRYIAFNSRHKKEMKNIWGVDIKEDLCMLDVIKREDDKLKAKENFDRALKGESFTLIEEYGDEEKKRAYYENHYSPITLPDGKVIGLTVYLTEVTERIRREKELKELNKNLEKLVEQRTRTIKENEKKLAKILELLPDVVAVHKEGRLVYLNRSSVNIFGYDNKEEMFRKNVIEFIHPDFKERVINRIRRLNSEEIIAPFEEIKFVKKDGSPLWGELSSFSTREEDGIYIYTFIRDLSERINARKQLENTHNIYLRVIENISGVPYKFKYEDNKYEFIGKGVKQLLRVEPETIDFKVIRNLIKEIVILDEKYKHLSPGEYAKKLRTGELERFRADYKIEFPDGEIKWINDSSIGIKDEKTGKIIGSLGILQDITDRKLTEERLKEMLSTTQHLIEDSSDGITIMDYDGNILEWNRSLEQIVGIKKEDAVKRKIWEITAIGLAEINAYNKTKKKIIEIHRKIVRSMIKTGRSRKFEWSILKDKNKISISIHTFVIKTETKRLLGAIVQDITRQKETEEKLRKAKEAAEKSNRLKSEFLAQISHEIRTPLNIILSFTDLIKSEVSKYLTDEVKYGFDAIGNASKRIIRTIDLILNMSEIQTGTFEPNLKEVCIDEIIESVFNEFKIFAAQKGLDLVLEGTEAYCKIIADEYSVKQIFVNLIENAIKYTNKGHVKISKEITKNKIKIAVEDSGIGIAEEYLPHIFDPFSQEYQGYSRKFEGNGLGLALVKEYCKINNAEITVESKKGVGTKFTVTFSVK